MACRPCRLIGRISGALCGWQGEGVSAQLGESLGLVGGLGGRRRGDDAVEHLVQAGEITVLHSCTTGLVVDGAGYLLPVEPETCVAADPVPEQAGGSAVAFPERMPVVPLVVVMCQPLDKLIPAHAAQIIVRAQLVGGETHPAFQHRMRQEELGGLLWSEVLADIYGAQ